MHQFKNLLQAAWLLLPVAVTAANVEEVTVTATRVPRAVAEVPVAVTVTDRQAIERSAPAIVVDALRGRSGVFVQQTTPGQGIPIVRGLKGSEVLHLVDGVRLNNALFRNAPNQYIGLLDPFLLSAVEVVRGPAPALYGSDAMGGVVQMFTAVPIFEGDQWQTQGRFKARLASADLSRTARLEWAAGRDGLSVAGGVSWHDADDLRAAGGREQAPSGYTSRAANASVAWRGAGGEWRVDAQYLIQPNTPRYDELSAGFGQAEPASEVFRFEPNSRLFLHARYGRGAAVGWMQDIQLHMVYQEVDDDRRARDTGSVQERRERNESALLGFTAQATSRPAASHTLIYGAEIYLDEVSSSRTSRNIDSGETRSVASRFPDGATMDSFAVFINDEVAVNPRTTLTAGARFSAFRTELPPADRGVGGKVALEDLTGNLGISFLAADGVHLTANLGRGFRSPNIFDLGTLGERPGNRFNEPNTDLQPESVVTFDAGVKYADGPLNAEVFAFVSDYRDKITSIPTGQIDAAGRTVVQSRNTNSVALRGLEAGGRLQVSESWRLSASLMWVEGEETGADGTRQPADRIPPLNGRLQLEYAPSPRLWVESWLRFASAQDELSDRDIGDPRIDPAGTAGWTTLNLRAGWRVRPSLMLQVHTTNILDRRYREHGSGIDAPGRGFGISVESRF